MPKVVVHLDGHTVIDDVEVVIHQNEISQTADQVVVSDVGYTEILMRMEQSPDAPTGLGATQTETAVTLFWDAVEDVEKYNVYRDGAYVATVETASYVDAGVDPGTLVTYTVVSIDEDLEPAFRFSVVSQELQVSFAGPDIAPDRMDVDAMIQTLQINNGGTEYSYGMPTFPLSISWLNGDGSFAGTPPVEGLQVRDGSGNIIGTTNFNAALSSQARNHYTVTLNSTGPATNLWVTWGEHPSTPDQIRGVYDTGFFIEAATIVSPPPANAAFPVLEGYGTDSSFSRNLNSGSGIAFITNLNDSGAGSAREALTRTDQRYIVPLVSGMITSESTITTRGAFSFQGETAQLAFRKEPTDGAGTFTCRDPNQLYRHIIVGHGQTTRANESSNRCIGLYNNNQVVMNCTLPFGIDDALDFWTSNGDVANTCTVAYNIFGPNLRNGYNGDAVFDGKGVLAGGMTYDLSLHHNLFFTGQFRGPEMAARFGDVRNNLVFGYERSMYFTRTASSTGGNHYSHAIKNLLILNQSTFDTRSDLNFLIDSNDTANGTTSNCHVDDNGYQIDNGAIQTLSPNVRNRANVRANPYTTSPITGAPVPSITEHELSVLEDEILNNAGSHHFNSDDFRNAIIGRVRARNYEKFDGVGGNSRWPSTYNGGTRNLWTPWPNLGGNGTVADAFPEGFVNRVPDSYRQSIGVANGTDLTIAHNGDGVPYFEKYIELVTGVPHW